jgi:hypothetical protein
MTENTTPKCFEGIYLSLLLALYPRMMRMEGFSEGG